MRALDGALGAIAAAHVLVLLRQSLEVLAAQRELAVAIRVHHETHHLRHRQTLGALAVALAAGAAVVRANLFKARREDLRVGIAERGGHGGEVLLRVARCPSCSVRCSGDVGVLDGPAQRRRSEIGGPRRLLRLSAAPPAPARARHHLHGDHADARLRPASLPRASNWRPARSCTAPERRRSWLRCSGPRCPAGSGGS